MDCGSECTVSQSVSQPVEIAEVVASHPCNGPPRGAQQPQQPHHSLHPIFRGRDRRRYARAAHRRGCNLTALLTK